MQDLLLPIQRVGITPEITLSGPARTDRSGPSVSSNYGKFGNGNGNQFAFNEPQQLLSTGISAVAAGVYHSLIVKSDGSLWSAGNNDKGQLGDGTTESRDTWVR